MSKGIIITSIVVVAVVVIFVSGWAIGNYITGPKDSSGGKVVSPTRPPHADTSGGPYYRGAVASDAENCSAIGVNILRRKGSAVDAAIATMLCVGVLNMHSTGIAGGGFMLVYNRSSRSAEVIDFREKAPGAATQDMFLNATGDAKFGGRSVAVPGEVRGYYKAWQKYGRLPWKDLVQPSINLAKDGFKIGKPVYETAEELKNGIYRDPGLKELLFDENDNLRNENSPITNLKYAATLKTIRNSPDSFYNGELAKNIIRDIQSMTPQGILTLADLKNYTVETRQGLRSRLGPDHVLHTTPPPTSGPVMNLLLNILKGYNMTSSDRDHENVNVASLTYHRILEAFRFAYAWRSRLGDPAFVNTTKIVQDMLDPSTGDYLRQNIWDNQTHQNVSYYANYFTKVDHGTSHLVVLAPNGDAVSLTSSINYRFGSMYRSTATGIIYNDQMADFDNPGSDKIAGLSPSKVNFPAPGKRPFSSMTPVIITDNDGNVKMVVGASGGKKIISATALAIMNKMWFGRTLSQAVEDPRVHVHLIPDNNVSYSKLFPKGILKGLEKRGNKLEEAKYYAAVQAITRENNVIFAQSDSRKNGKPAGF